ncbi:site-specific integrase [Pseudomonas kermanshahensis]|uniref:Site-specific integrase n=1 Tax=Pseudomonas kermanshahensis TaxID=2745482 RepID=A0ABU8R6T4_9PSED
MKSLPAKSRPTDRSATNLADNTEAATHSEHTSTNSTKSAKISLTIDLNATANPKHNTRLFWNGNVLVSLETNNTDCSPLLAPFSHQARESFKQATIQYRAGGRLGIRSLIRIISTLRTAAKDHPTDIIDSNWITKCLKQKRFRKQKLAIRLFLEHWKDRYPHAITAEALNLLAQVRNGVSKSDNVNSDDPEKGWLTDEEFDYILQTTWTHYDATGDVQSALLRLLSLQYARRPSQLRDLKFSDLKTGPEKNHTEAIENEIHFPSRKEHFIDTEFRGSKIEEHPIADHLWHMLQIQRNKIQFCFESVLHTKLSDSQVQLLPIFTTIGRILKACRTLENILHLNPLDNLGDELFHMDPNRIAGAIAFKYDLTINRDSTKPPILPLSQRTGKPIYVHAIRLRHTRIRQLARQGVPRAILSHWLGHISDKSLHSYYNDPAEQARQIDELLAPMLTPIAMAFTGTIIATDAEATYPNDPLKRLDFANDGLLHYLGRCGKFSFCATTSIPIPCYRCRNFEPLVDAPHEEVLDALRYRQAQEQALIMKSGSMRDLLIPIDLSGDIRAVERCITQCKIKRGD